METDRDGGLQGLMESFNHCIGLRIFGCGWYCWYIIPCFNICQNSGPTNSLPLSWMHCLGLEYLLSQVSSKVFATIFDLSSSTGITSGKSMTASMQVTALNWYSSLLITAFQGPIMLTWTLSQRFRFYIFLGGR